MNIVSNEFQLHQTMLIECECVHVCVYMYVCMYVCDAIHTLASAPGALTLAAEKNKTKTVHGSKKRDTCMMKSS